MDPASVISFGLTVFKKINEIRKEIKSAPEQLESLQDFGQGIQIVLLRLQKTHVLVQLGEDEELAYLERLTVKAQNQLDKVDAFVNKIQQQADSSAGKRRVKIVAWMMGKDDFKDISRKLRDLRETLDMMMSIIAS